MAPSPLHRTFRALLALSLLVGPAAPAGARPLALRTRPLATPSPEAAGRSAAPLRAGGVETACGASLEATAEAYARHLARAAPAPSLDALNVDSGEIAVLEDDGSFFYSDVNGHTVFDPFAGARAFYRTHGDDYDQVAFWFSSGQTTWLGSAGAFAAAYVVRNDTQGLGMGTFDIADGTGSAGRLQSLLVMNGMDKFFAYPDSSTTPEGYTTMDLLAHEFGHRWLAYVAVDSAGQPTPALLGRAFQHWSFFADVDGSIMEGGGWARASPDSFFTDSVTIGYCALDRYLMGLRGKAETPPLFVVNDPHGFNPPGDYARNHDPFVGLGCLGTATYWSVDDIEGAEGPRVPDAASSPHAFRLAFALVVPKGGSPSPADLAKLEVFRARFPAYFSEATRGEGSANSDLDSRAGSVAIRHRPLADTESLAEPRAVGARVSVEGGGLALAVNASSVMLHWRPAGGGAWSDVPFAAAGADSFVAVFPAPGAAGAYEYWISAASDSATIAATLPAAGPAAPFAFTAGPDLAPPSITHVRLASQGQAMMPQRLLARVTDNTALDSVWAEYRVDGGPLQSAAAASAGADSFRVALGAGLPQGHEIAYRFVARDRAAAPNLAFSNASFDTLRIGRDDAWETENGADNWFHLPYWYSYRDAWTFSTSWSSPAGGTAWKCGAPDGGHYPPHLDANLYSPLLADVVPGTFLRFDHRYDLEEADSVTAFDGARVEVSVNNGAWQLAMPAAGYGHELAGGPGPFATGAPCWSGVSQGWRSEVVDLSPFAPGPIRIRFRMLADDFIEREGWFVDHVRLLYPSGPVTDVPGNPAPLSLGAPWPNPARDELRLSVALGAASRLEWELFDVQGRRVATLWRGTLAAGAHALRGALPASVRAGLYFASARIEGGAARTDRVVVVR